MTIADIRAHPWYRQIEHQPPYTPPIFLGKEPIPIDPKITAMLQKDHNIEPAKAEQEIKRNKFNNVTTTYYLLLKRKERAGILRQQYQDDVKKLLRRKNPTNSPEVPVTPERQEETSPQAVVGQKIPSKPKESNYVKAPTVITPSMDPGKKAPAKEEG